MGNKVNAGLAQKLSSPNQFALVTSTDGDKTNVMALSWWTYCSNHPMTVAICIGNRSYSGDSISKNGEFCVCLPGEELAQSALKAGCTSGRNMDKAYELGIELVPSDTVKPFQVANSRLVLECRLFQTIQLSDHRMFIAEVTGMRSNPEVKNLMAVNGYTELSAVEING